MTWERVTNQAQTDMFCSLEKGINEGREGWREGERRRKKEEREKGRKEGSHAYWEAMRGSSLNGIRVKVLVAK